MSRRTLGAALAGSLLFSVPAGCGGPDKQVKTSTAKKKKKAERANLLTEAREEAKAGEVESADKAYAAAYELEKEFEILEERVDFLIRAGRGPKAQDISKIYYDDHATDAKAYALYAEALLANNRGLDALEVADQLLALAGDDPVGYERKGRALMLLEKHQEGIEALRTAVKLDPQSALFHIALGNALHKLKGSDINEAALEFRAALKSAPDDSMASALLGMALRDQNELDESRQYLDKAIELDPDNGRAYFELGLLLNVQGKQTDAEVALSKAVQKAPNDSRFWYAYGEIFRVQERFDEAISAYTKAVDLEPPHPKAIAKLGILLVDRKDWKEAEAVLTKAARRDPKNAVVYLHLGVVYAATRRNKVAIETFEKFLELAPKTDPDRDRAQDAIRELKRRK